MREWTADLAVGVAEIDSQHKALFAKLNDLSRMMSSGTANAEIPRVVDFLARYVVDHFATEERFMARYGYPSASSHKLHHQAFTRELAAVQREIATSGVSTGLILAVYKKATEWLVTHISKTDKILGAFIKSKAAA